MSIIYRRELCNLKNEDEARLLVEVAGKALKSRKYGLIKIQACNSKLLATKEEIEEIEKMKAELIAEGYSVEIIWR